MRVPGTTGYTEAALHLAHQYESVRFATVHAPWLPHLPSSPSRIADIGSGSGRDATALAHLGHLGHTVTL